MKSKLTLNIEEAVVLEAKNYAQKNGKRLSSIIKNFLKAIASEERIEESISHKVLKLMGRIKLPKDFDYKKSVAKAIAKKHAKK